MNDIVGVAPQSRGACSLTLEAGHIVDTNGHRAAQQRTQRSQDIQYNFAIRLFKYRINALLTRLLHLFVMNSNDIHSFFLNDFSRVKAIRNQI